ncbi:MAG: hypothetical protein PHQ65_15685 [Bacteroidales bacterium]|nr:hypothetical protein [Bacteroidales bacterium]MDD3666707.1 hypothetical protein [Bacteroidales bacterium]
MRKYLTENITRPGSITLGYEDGTLRSVEFSAEVDQGRMMAAMKSIPLAEGELKMWGTYPNIRITEIPADLSFAAFWNAYGHKVNRKRSEELWNKINEADRLQCMLRLPKYFDYCRRHNRLKKDPDTYLRNKSWIDEMFD